MVKIICFARLYIQGDIPHGASSRLAYFEPFSQRRSFDTYSYVSKQRYAAFSSRILECSKRLLILSRQSCGNIGGLWMIAYSQARTILWFMLYTSLITFVCSDKRENTSEAHFRTHRKYGSADGAVSGARCRLRWAQR
jgi:hypothetical protein